MADNRLVIGLVIALLLIGIFCLVMSNSTAQDTGEKSIKTSAVPADEPLDRGDASETEDYEVLNDEADEGVSLYSGRHFSEY